jgi:hypothetical protein
MTEYLTALPETIPPGRALVHNQVYPVAQHPGTRGSRCWLQPPSDRLEVCDCGWASHLGQHYRMHSTDAPPHSRESAPLREDGGNVICE